MPNLMATFMKLFVRKFFFPFFFIVLCKKNTGLDPTFQGVFRKRFSTSCFSYLNIEMFAGTSTRDQTVNGQPFKKDDHIFLDVGSANLDVSWMVDHQYNTELMHYSKI